jgi:hypothetical protein
MKPLAACLLAGLCSCAPSVPAPTLSVVGRWEQVGVRTVTRDPAGRLLADVRYENDPGSVWLELTAADSVYLVHQGVRTTTRTAYAYRAGTLRFRDAAQGETAHPVRKLTAHRLVYRTHNQTSAGTEDVTFTYRR